MKIKDDNTLVYAVKHKNKNVIKSSSSGGLFTALSDVFLDNGNAVASCVYNYKTDKVEFKIYQDKNTRDYARGSKYIQASIGNGFKDVSEWLMKNPEKSLIAFGTGCQMDGLRRYLQLKNLRHRVILIDIICHGATSPGLWEKYLKDKNLKGKLDYISFKDKRNGWHNPTVFVKSNGNEISIKDFYEWFYGEWAIRESCYSCPFTRIERDTDMTIGDYWGIENVMPDFADPMGVSLMLIHSNEGKKLFEKIKDSIEYRESNQIDCLQPRLISPAEHPKDRKRFWDDVNSKGIEYCSKKYKEDVLKTSIWRKVVRKAKSIIKKLLNK